MPKIFKGCELKLKHRKSHFFLKRPKGTCGTKDYLNKIYMRYKLDQYGVLHTEYSPYAQGKKFPFEEYPAVMEKFLKAVNHFYPVFDVTYLLNHPYILFNLYLKNGDEESIQMIENCVHNIIKYNKGIIKKNKMPTWEYNGTEHRRKHVLYWVRLELERTKNVQVRANYYDDKFIHDNYRIPLANNSFDFVDYTHINDQWFEFLSYLDKLKQDYLEQEKIEKELNKDKPPKESYIFKVERVPFDPKTFHLSKKVKPLFDD